MQTVFRIRGYRFFFFSREGSEPPHVHIEQTERSAKFWLEPIALAESFRFRSHEITELAILVEAHKREIVEKWNEHFGSKD